MGKKNRKNKASKQKANELKLPKHLQFQPADNETSTLSNTLLKYWNEAHKSNYSLQDVPFLFVTANITTQIRLHLEKGLKQPISLNYSSLHSIFKCVNLPKRKGHQKSTDSSGDVTDAMLSSTPVSLNEQRSLIEAIVLSLFADPFQYPPSKNIDDIDHHRGDIGKDDSEHPTTYVASLKPTYIKKLIQQCHSVSEANSYHLQILRDELIRNDINNALIDLQFLWEEVMAKRLPDDTKDDSKQQQQQSHHKKSKQKKNPAKLSDSQFHMLNTQYHSIEQQLTVLRREMNRLHSLLSEYSGDDTNDHQHQQQQQQQEDASSPSSHRDDDCSTMTDTTMDDGHVHHGGDDHDDDSDDHDTAMGEGEDATQDDDDDDNDGDDDDSAVDNDENTSAHEMQLSETTTSDDAGSSTSYDMSDTDDDSSDNEHAHAQAHNNTQDMSNTVTDPANADKIASIAAELDEIVNRFNTNTQQLDLAWYDQCKSHLVNVDDSEEDQDLRKAGLTHKIQLHSTIDREHTPFRWSPEQITAWYSNLEKVHREYYYIGEVVMKKLFQVDSIETTCDYVRSQRKLMVKKIYSLLDSIDTKKVEMKKHQALLYPVFKYATSVLANEKAASETATEKEEHGDEDQSIIPSQQDQQSDDDSDSSSNTDEATDDDDDHLEAQELTKTKSQTLEQVNPKLLQYPLDFYRKLPKLSPQMEMVEDKDAYTIRAVIPNLHYDSLALTVVPDTARQYGRRPETLLRLTGTVLPTPSQEQQMITRTKQLFQQQQADKYHRMYYGAYSPQAIDPYYLQQSIYKLCSNKYGDITRMIEVPHDGDISTTTLTYDDSVLLITIPKKRNANSDIPLVRRVANQPQPQSQSQPQRQQQSRNYRQPPPSRPQYGYNPYMSSLPFGF